MRDYLLSKGVGDERMTVVGYGEAKPIADNATEEGRLQNRRVVMRRRDCDEPKYRCQRGERAIRACSGARSPADPARALGTLPLGTRRFLRKMNLPE